MSKSTESKSLLTAMGASLALSLSLAPLAQADENPFGAKFFAAGTQVAAEHSCGAEGKCGAMTDDDDADKKDKAK
jgi:uncharacterized low-complexity protein